MYTLNLLRRMLYVEYRLAVTKDGKTTNIYSGKRKCMTHHFAHKGQAGYNNITLYKKGPFRLPERKVKEGGCL